MACLGFPALSLALLASLLLLLQPTMAANSLTQALASTVVTVKDMDTLLFGISAQDSDWGDRVADQGARGREYYELFYNVSWLNHDPFGCPLSSSSSNNNNRPSINASKPFALLVDRGECTFGEKALVAQQVGASALIVTDTLSQVYNRTQNVNATKVTRMMAYDCANGQATVSEDQLALFLQPNSSQIPQNSCQIHRKCDSKLCVPTGGASTQVCCVWDVPDPMGGGAQAGEITIQVVRLGIADGQTLKNLLAAASPSSPIKVALYKRDPPIMDLSQVLLWALAVLTICMAAYQGSSMERRKAAMKDKSQTTLVERQALEREEANEPVLELSWVHALGFLIVGSGVLLLIFYVNVVMIVIVVFALGAVSAVNQILMSGLVARIRWCRDNHLPFQLPKWVVEDGDDRSIRVSDFLGLLLSLGLVLFWFLHRHSSFAWVLQDVFGVCICIVFLKTLRLPNLRVATILLVLVFLYDIFMVFITPLIFHESVMIKAAKGGNQGSSSSAVGEEFCWRYPTNTEYKCHKEQIPIVLRMPKILDYRLGAECMLGLGDIVLPGLLVVFCARYDYATRGCIAVHKNHDLQRRRVQMTAANERHCRARYGLCAIVVLGYALGLFLAMMAVILMNQGQPALLYLVPCTLGFISLACWRRRIYGNMWRGPVEFGRLPESCLDTGAASVNSEYLAELEDSQSRPRGPPTAT